MFTIDSKLRPNITPHYYTPQFSIFLHVTLHIAHTSDQQPHRHPRKKNPLRCELHYDSTSLSILLLNNSRYSSILLQTLHARPINNHIVIQKPFCAVSYIMTPLHSPHYYSTTLRIPPYYFSHYTHVRPGTTSSSKHSSAPLAPL